ncbi:MAG: hypothetical protein IPM42_13435 [Saprospiraceae bacterium]|nr:hypothetical protein [Saprospiraceae bacterium]
MRIFCFVILLLISCKSIKKLNNHASDIQIEVINGVLNYLNNLNPKIHFGYGPPFKINQTIAIDTLSCNYLYSNFQYYVYFVDQQDFEKPKNIDYNYSYDYKGIQNLLNKEWKLSADTSQYTVPVQILTEDDMVYGTKMWPRGTFCFSPLIPIRKKDIFEIWLTIEKDRDPPFYRFRIEKIKGKFVVTRHSWSDWCDLVTDKDYIKELK